jgi:hypothetical protein
MSKRLFWRSIIFLLLAIFVVLIGQTALFLIRDNSGSPAYFSTYTDTGYYEIHPETILAALAQGNTDVFTPFFGDPDRDEPHYDAVAWTQSDYLKIVNALSLEIWNEPLDLNKWRVVDIDLMRDCNDSAHGFDTFTITFYKDLGITKWERHYTTRLIQINSWQGLVRWGGNATLSAPLLLGWDGFDLTQFKVTGDDALQIAEKSGGSNARMKVNNSCYIVLSANQLSAFPHRKNWLASYERADFYIHINPYTGEYEILR